MDVGRTANEKTYVADRRKEEKKTHSENHNPADAQHRRRKIRDI